MKKNYIALLFTAFALALIMPSGTLLGKPTPKPTPKPQPTVIGSIDANSITVKGPHEDVDYKITQFTDIKFKGEPAKVSDLKVGMRVSVTASSIPGEAALISADDPPKKK